MRSNTKKKEPSYNSHPRPELIKKNEINERIISLDAFRGFVVGFMILVNNPGSWSHIYTPLRHAKWHGWSPTDLVFPFFLFIVGVAMAQSLSKRIETGTDPSALRKKICIRAAIMIAFGLFLNGFPFNIPLNAEMAANFEFMDIFRRFQTIRLVGVLPRIGLAYFIGGLIVLYFQKNRSRLLASTLIFIFIKMLHRPWPLKNFIL